MTICERLTIQQAASLRHACRVGGIPAIFYADNGSGYKNASIKDRLNQIKKAVPDSVMEQPVAEVLKKMGAGS